MDRATDEPAQSSAHPVTDWLAAPGADRGDISRRAVRGGVFIALGQGYQLLVQLAAMAILARLLDPESFGILAMAAIVPGFFMRLRDLGLGTATYQRQELSHDQASAIYWIFVAVGVTLAAVLVVVAPGIAWIYGRPELVNIVRVLALGVVFGSLGLQHRALLRRNLRFRTLAIIDGFAPSVGSCLGIALAYLSYGYWALVAIQVTRPMVMSLCCLIACGWRPGRWRRGSGIRTLVSFGAFLSASGLFVYLMVSLDNFLIGLIAGATELGYYSRAYVFLELATNKVSLPISGVVGVALSRLQDSPGEFRRFYRQALTLTLSLIAPALLFLELEASEIVILVLGEGWERSAVLLRLLTFFGLATAFNGARGWALIPLGKGREYFNTVLVDGVLAALAMLIGCQWGAEGVACALSVHGLLVRTSLIAYSLRYSVVTGHDVVAGVARPVAAAAFSTVVAYLLGVSGFTPGPGLAGLSLRALAFAGVYVLAWVLLPGGRTQAREVLAFLGDVRRPREAPCEADESVMTTPKVVAAPNGTADCA